jgi:endonuclease YncB( thermonuclease family)
MSVLRSLLVLVCLTSPAFADRLEGAPVVVDGDSLHVGGQKLRLFGIDAPEMDQACSAGTREWSCGRWSADQLAAMAGAWVVCRGDRHDRYGRLLATCEAGGQDLGAAMVAAGAAVAYVRYSDAYSEIEAFARAKEAGIWGGGMEMPEAHRHGAPQAVPGDCAIKGNISGNGRIYHRPGQENYDATQINPARGEQWFCTPAEAEAAGFRAARR